MDVAQYDDILHRIYASTLDPAAWSGTLGAIAGALGANRALLFTFMHGPERGGFCFTHNLPQNQLEAWAEVSQVEDPFVQILLERNLLRDGAVFEGGELVPRVELARTRMYRDIWVNWDIEHLCFGVIFDGSDGHKLPTGLCLYRGSQEQTFNLEEVELVRRLLRHLSGALGVMFHLRDCAHQLAATRDSLNRLSSAVVLLDHLGGIQFANIAAHRMLGEARLFRKVSHGPSRAEGIAPVSSSRTACMAFYRAVGLALRQWGGDEAEHFSDAVILPDEDGKPACVMHAVPLGQAAPLASGGSEPSAIMFFYDMSGSATAHPGLLCSLFGMTHAEALAALQVLEGGSNTDMAARLGVSVNTLKTQLQAAYAKSNTNRRVDMLKLLLALGSVRS